MTETSKLGDEIRSAYDEKEWPGGAILGWADDVDALLAMVRTAEWKPDWATMRKAIKWSKVNFKICGDYPTVRWGADEYLRSARFGRIGKALAGLPEHLRGDTDV